MSQDFMDPELLSDFIIEAKEHLETIEPNLLELEKAPDNLSLLDEIFRPMHSLKGASGFLGLNRINELAHKAESILDELRKGAVSVTPEIMDIILSTTDALRQMIDNLANDNIEGDVDTGPLINTLDALLKDAPHCADHSEASTLEDESPARPDNETLQTDGGEQRQAGDVTQWLSTREKQPAYPLTAFGEEHLRDFIEEAGENIVLLSDGLLLLEKKTDAHGEIVNDLFRYFHNLKGNSGIIGFRELNSLTHEAETLLNSIRKNEREAAGPLVDLLLLVVDTLEALVRGIDTSTGAVTPFDISELLEKLRQAVAGEAVSLPESLLAASGNAANADEQDAATPVGHEKTGPASPPDKEPGSDEAGSGRSVIRGDQEDIAVFKNTADQQFYHIQEAIAGMRKEGENREWADVMFRSLSTLQNSCGFMGLDEIKTYARRTADVVDHGRSTGLDFSVLADLLEQECAIIRDMIKHAIGSSLAGYVLDDDEDGAFILGAGRPESGRQAQPVQAAGPGEKYAGQKHPGKEHDEDPALQGPALPGPAHLGSALPGPALLGSPPAAAAPVAPASAVSAPVDATVPVLGETPAATAKHDFSPLAKPSAKSIAAQAETGHKAPSTIRVDHEKLDHLMNLIGELIINRNRYAMLARQLEGGSADVVEIAQNLTETTYSMARISDDLQDTIMKVRMVPVASVFSRFPRLVRDLSRKIGKEVDLLMEGEDTELDKNVVEVIGDPLIHLIRNSVDHGIEPEEERVKHGKPAKGSIWLRAFYKGNSVVIEVEDDGKGIDSEQMRDVAVRKGIISQDDAKALDEREALDLIFAPGFSSADVITDISGRGVGMDVVRTNIKNLKGSISISSEPGKGTRFTLTLPLTLAIIDALMVNVDDQVYAIPLDAVSETNKIESARLNDVKGRKAITLRDEVLGIVSLAEVLGLPCKVPLQQQEMLSLVIIQDNDRRLGLVVDRLLERQEIVIKPLGPYLGDIRGFSGATIMGDGSVILILDPHEIYALATSKGTRQADNPL